ncbi:MAG: hypothetical protein MUF42_04015 [Cytophagaceae bacterium]|jgi:predicted metal-dependent HD superfamily phosphohydrolase|nr:hypothetical protein [Cytophagaceae bacterium]
MHPLGSFWNALANRLQLPDASRIQRWKEIEKRHSSPLRRYHNLKHLQLMSEGLVELQPDFDPLIALAIFYHDIVYNTMRKDNEERSALLAAMRMEPFLDSLQLKTLQQYILSTKSHIAQCEEEKLLLDLDLNILSSDPRDYQAYARQIRIEYLWCPAAFYKKGRIKVLESFLERPFIYQTTFFRNKGEAKARINLLQEINDLKN